MSAPATATDVRLLRPGFVAWLGAATGSAVGDGVLYFALAWTASGLGPGAATLVLVAGLVPEVALTLVGGVVADRWGVRRTLVASTAAMVGVLAGFLLALATGVPMLALLVAVSVAQGVATAFQGPAGSVVPRLFFPEAAVGRALALTGSVLSMARLVGPPLGAVVVVALSLGGVLVVDLVTFVVVLVVLRVVRPPYEAEPVAASGTARHDLAAGLRALRAAPGMVPLLGSVALVAGGLLPLLALAVPLLVRERGWAAHDAGVIEACWIGGGLALSLAVARLGTRDRARPPLVVGPVLAAAGAVGLAVAPHPPAAYGAALLMGVGTTVYTTHLFPLYLLRSPAEMQARFSSVLIVVQMVVLLLGTLAAGAAATRFGIVPVLLGAAAVCATAGLPVLTSRTLR
ncbi:MFS transporter [Nocardioides sp. GXQ0305]|uniref:MFS transporter n=1 Tax=Nocardioides sp. GXQ0305 TaxID=3423912 RepID=UPI003D7D88BB